MWPKIKIARSRDASDRCWSISRERNVLGIPKLVGRLSTQRAIMRSRFKVKGQGSRSPGRLMLRPEVRHIFRTGRPTNFKLDTQTEHEDPHQRQVQWPPRSKVKVARSRDASDRCWPISRERNVLYRNTKIGRTVAHPMANNAQQFQGQSWSTKTRIADKRRQPVTRHCWDRNCIISTEREDLRTSELVPQWSMRCQLSYPAIKLWSWVLARGRGHTVSAAPGGHVACLTEQRQWN